MKSHFLVRWINKGRLVTTVMALILVACGANNPSDGSASIIDGSGSPVPDIAVAGPIVGFGSVIVEGVHYQTDKASIYIDGQPASEEDLNLGDFITIQATYDPATNTYGAKVIVAETSVQGTVTAVDNELSEILVLGQRVKIEGNTVFDEQFNLRGIEAIRVGESIKVSGGSDGAGRIYATRISTPQSMQTSFAGYMAQLDEIMMTFVLNGIVVDFSSADYMGHLHAKDWVTVTGAFNENGDRFIAKNIRAQPMPIQNGKGAQSRTEGLVEEIFAEGFGLQGSRVLYSEATRFEGGTVKDILAGTKVAVEGTLNSDLQIVAKKIRLLNVKLAELYGAVEQVTLAAGDKPHATETGTLVVQGRTVAVDGRTIISALDGLAGKRARLSDVRVGDNVYISLMPANPSGIYPARLIELGWRKDFMGKEDGKPPMDDNPGPIEHHENPPAPPPPKNK